ncbi:hypothetical protein SAMN02745126_06383 [Enhydrobacter aerosaccus]|uniref:Uncharacterized protein n=1 Tax=Enhydrobacter aerosaccus TaxID=225324 RepID=A0A1T4TJF8_9HYPH|nr:hypothetical protein [Enhydrobacter aerosaccus]SKA40583.1 hypothetical protein SAMN02745126_06383 [Enhydrobacter aerosaccus]
MSDAYVNGNFVVGSVSFRRRPKEREERAARAHLEKREDVVIVRNDAARAVIYLFDGEGDSEGLKCTAAYIGKGSHARFVRSFSTDVDRRNAVDRFIADRTAHEQQRSRDKERSRQWREAERERRAASRG